MHYLFYLFTSFTILFYLLLLFTIYFTIYLFTINIILFIPIYNFFIVIYQKNLGYVNHALQINFPLVSC